MKLSIKNKNVDFKIMIIIVIGFAFMISVLFFMVSEYTKSLKITLDNETKTYLTEISQQVTVVMNERSDMNIKNLNTSASSMEFMSEMKKNDIIKYLNNESKRYDYVIMSVVGNDGIALSSKGKVYNVSKNETYLKALLGKNSISDVTTSTFNNIDCIEYAVPIFVDDEIKGVLMAEHDLESLKKILEVKIFDGKGYSRVINKLGVIIIKEDGENYFNIFNLLEEASVDEGYSVLKFKNDIKYGISGLWGFTINGVHEFMYYKPLAIKDWSILVSVPSNVVTQKTNIIIKGTLKIGVTIVFIITALMITIAIVQMKNRKKLEFMLYVDSITGGMSQAKFEKEVKHIITNSPEGTYAFVHINIEKFKIINESFGKDIGNKTLKYVYDILNKNISQDEIVSRFSADNYCVLMKAASEYEMIKRLNDINEDINSFNVNSKNKYILSFSVGIYIIDSSETEINLIHERANIARKSNKNSSFGSSGGIAFYDEHERKTMMKEKNIENKMNEALVNGEFEVYLQPKYELKENTIAGAEALIRWNDPKKGIVPPNDFIPLFEKNGFIVNIDRFVFETICKLIQKWSDAGIKIIPISVNLSKVHLRDPDFLKKYEDIYKQYNFPAKYVEIELTESIVFENFEFLLHIINEIHSMGFRCSLDDFGSGYSSLNMLKDIPVDALKLDRAFFYSKNSDNERSRHVIESVINLADKLKMETVSEGIEFEEQVEFLRKSNCDMIQGFIFAKPMKISEFEKLSKINKN